MHWFLVARTTPLLPRIKYNRRCPRFSGCIHTTKKLFQSKMDISSSALLSFKTSGQGIPQQVMCIIRKDAKRNVVYFPGDIQDEEEMMKRSQDSEWTDYSLERTCQLLHERFENQQANTWIMRPSRILNSQSEFDSFLRPGLGVLHLKASLKSCESVLSEKYQLAVNADLPITMVAFSKGSVVVNHCIAEIATAIECFNCSHTDCDNHLPNNKPLYILDWESEETSKMLPKYIAGRMISRTHILAGYLDEHKQEILDFFHKVEAIHWVDGHRFPTDETVLKDFVKYLEYRQSVLSQSNNEGAQNSKLQLFIHGTPRQLKDNSRKWIAAEHKIWTTFLEGCGQIADLHVQNYFEKEPKSLANHFKCLTVFQTSPSSQS